MNNRIRECRKAAGMSQKYVSVTLGLAGPSISNWESGKTKPSNENLVKLAALFGVSVDYLLGLESPEPIIPATKNAPADDLTEQIMAKARGMTVEELQQLLRIMDAVKNN